MTAQLHGIRKKANVLLDRNRTNILTGAMLLMAVVAFAADPAAATVGTAVTNGTSILNGGISVAQTEPLNWIIETFAVGIGALFFVRVVRKLA